MTIDYRVIATQYDITLIKTGVAIIVKVQNLGEKKLAAKAILVKYPKTKTFLVTNVFVYKRYRGQGYGKHLIEKVIDYADRKKRDLMLYVKPTNTTAIGLYQKFGFEPCGDLGNKLIYKRRRIQNGT